MKFWILQGKLDSTPALQPGIPPNRDCWRIRFPRHMKEMEIGGIAFIWSPNSDEEKRGICNVSDILSKPPHGDKFESQIKALWDSFHHHMPEDRYSRMSLYPAILAKTSIQMVFVVPLLR